MSNLTPEKRMDKNGRLVTRHVKGNASDSSTDRSIPAPSASKSRPTSKAGYAKEISEFLLEAAGEEDRELVNDMYTKYIGIRPLKLLYDRMKNWGERDSDTFENTMSSLIIASINNNYSQLKRDRHITSLIEAMPVISAFGGDYPQPRDIYGMIEKADTAAGLNKLHLNIDYVSEDDRSAFRLLAFDEIVGVPPKFRTREQLDQEAQWFDENMDALTLHISTLRKRKTTDPELMKELVSGETPSAMSSGLL
jgi:hypothetical protein